MTKIKLIITLAVLLMFLTQPAYAETINYTTTHPTDGTPVEFFQWAVSMDGGEFEMVPTSTTEPSIALEFESNRSYRVMVRGVDAEGHAGKWSSASDVYMFGSPGLCSKPEVASK